jgi:hypothetical protein
MIHSTFTATNSTIASEMAESYLKQNRVIIRNVWQVREYSRYANNWVYTIHIICS